MIARPDQRTFEHESLSPSVDAKVAVLNTGMLDSLFVPESLLLPAAFAAAPASCKGRQHAAVDPCEGPPTA